MFQYSTFLCKNGCGMLFWAVEYALSLFATAHRCEFSRFNSRYIQLFRATQLYCEEYGCVCNKTFLEETIVKHRRSQPAVENYARRDLLTAKAVRDVFKEYFNEMG